MKTQIAPVPSRYLVWLFAFLCLLGASLKARAQVWTWNLPTTSNGTGLWNTPGNWIPPVGSPGTIPNSTDAVADLYIDYTPASNLVINLAGTRTLGSLTLGDRNAAASLVQFGGGSTTNTLRMSATEGAHIIKESSNTFEMYRITDFASSTTVSVNGGILKFGTGSGGTSRITGTANVSFEGSGGVTLFTARGIDATTDNFSTGYTGNITVRNGGTLRINNTLLAQTDTGVPLGTVTVANTGVLGGSGTVQRATTVQSGGTLSPVSGTTLVGGGAAVMTYTQGLEMETGSKFAFDLFANTADVANRGQALGFDGINVTGGVLTIEEGVTFDLTFNGSGSTVDFSNSFWESEQQWLIFSNSFAPTTPFGGNIFTVGSISTDSFGNAFGTTGGAFSFRQDGNDVYLVYGVIPEPSSSALLILGLGGLMACRRRAKMVRAK